jgi:hypothetical protein
MMEYKYLAQPGFEVRDGSVAQLGTLGGVHGTGM